MTPTTEQLVEENARLRLWLSLSLEDRLVDFMASLKPTSVDAAGVAIILRPPNQVEMADAVGSSRECVGRVLRKLREEGLWEVGKPGGASNQPPVTIRLMPALFERAHRTRAAR